MIEPTPNRQVWKKKSHEIELNVDEVEHDKSTRTGPKIAIHIPNIA